MSAALIEGREIDEDRVKGAVSELALALGMGKPNLDDFEITATKQLGLELLRIVVAFYAQPFGAITMRRSSEG